MDITCCCDIDRIIILIEGIEHIIIPRGRMGLQAWKEHDKKFVVEVESQAVLDGRVLTYKNECHYDDKEKWRKVLKLIRENI